MGGGTKCSALLCDLQGRPLASGQSGAANIMTDPNGALDNILSATFNALESALLPRESIGEVRAYLGLAGANVGEAAKNLLPKLPFAQAKIDSDAVIALEGALGEEDGAVGIVGTGSAFIYRKSGNIGTMGGWGFTVGDQASGARLGRSLLQETLLVHDGVRQGSELIQAVLSKFEHDPVSLVEYAHFAKPGEFGVFAPMIFEFAGKKDATALAIVRAAVAELEETLASLRSRGIGKICLLGGLGKKYMPYLSDTYRKNIYPPLGDAVSGAVQLAVSNFGESSDNESEMRA